MARIETYSAQGHIDVPGAPNLPASPRVPALGAAAAQGAEYAGGQLAHLGGAVQNAGADITAYYQQKQAEADQAWLAKATAETKLNQHITETTLFSGGAGADNPTVVATGAPPKPVPLSDQVSAGLKAYGEGVSKSAPSEHAKKAYDQWLLGETTDAQIRAFDYQHQQQEQQKKADFITALDTHTRLVGTDPTQFDTAWASVQRDLQAASQWMDPAALAQLRAKTRADMELTRAKTLATQQPLAFQREVTPQQYDAASGTGTPSKGWADNPYYSHLDPAQIAALSQDANSAVVRQHAAVNAAQKTAYDQRYNDLMTTLLPGGQGGMSDVWEARKQGWLTDYGDIKKAIDAINVRDKDSMDLAKAQALFTTGHTFNPFQKDDQAATDLVYKSAGGADGLLGAPISPMAGQGGLDGQAQAALRLTSFVEKTDIVPQAAVDELRRGMISQDKGEMMNAFTLMDGLSRGHPGAVSRSFGEEDMKRLDQYRVLAPLTAPEDLVKAMNPNIDPATAKARKEMGETGKKLLETEVTKGDDYLPSILSHFNPGVVSNVGNWTSAPGAPVDPVAMQSLRDDYETTFHYLYSLSGDEVSAKAGALTALDRKWGVTEVGSGVTIMPRPPERNFPAIGGDHSWMERQAEDAVKAAYPDAQNWTPVTLPETEGALGIRQTPSYGLGIHDASGTWHVLVPPAGAKPGWPFDYEAAHAQAVQDFNDTRGSLINAPKPRELFNPLKTITDGISGASHEAARRGESLHPQRHGSVQLPPPMPQYPESAFSPSGVRVEGDHPPLPNKHLPEAYLGVRG